MVGRVDVQGERRRERKRGNGGTFEVCRTTDFDALGTLGEVSLNRYED